LDKSISDDGRYPLAAKRLTLSKALALLSEQIGYCDDNPCVNARAPKCSVYFSMGWHRERNRWMMAGQLL